VVRYRGRRGPGGSEPREAILASRTIINHVVESREGVLCSNVIHDKRFEAGKSVQNLGMRTVLCVPIVARDQVLGVIHIDNPVRKHTYNEHELRLITAIGYQTGLAIENARLVQAALQRERLAAAGETVAYLSHSIKNILQGMRSGSDVMKRGIGKQDLDLTAQGWRILDRNLDKCFALMLNMLAFSKQREPQLESYQLNDIINDVVALEQNSADEAGIVLLTDLEEKLPQVPADYDGVHQVVLNLIGNALDAVPREKGVVTVRTRFDPVERHAVIIVKDNGPGVPPDVAGKIFEPFFSTKGHGGTGLGLAVSRKISLELGGELKLESPPDGGAEFHFRLPTADVRREGPGDTRAPSRRDLSP
jgi:signal transduction histidine kinase